MLAAKIIAVSDVWSSSDPPIAPGDDIIHGALQLNESVELLQGRFEEHGVLSIIELIIANEYVHTRL